MHRRMKVSHFHSHGHSYSTKLEKLQRVSRKEPNPYRVSYTSKNSQRCLMQSRVEGYGMIPCTGFVRKTVSVFVMSQLRENEFTFQSTLHLLLLDGLGMTSWAKKKVVSWISKKVVNRADSVLVSRYHLLLEK